jgi:hypothetical protein
MLACHLKNDHAPQPSSLLRASLARNVDPESVRGLSGFPLKPLGKFSRGLRQTSLDHISSRSVPLHITYGESRADAPVPYLSTGLRKTHGFIRRFFAGSFELGFATNLSGFCRIRVSHPRGTWGPVTVSRSATTCTRSIRLHRSTQAMSCHRLFRADVEISGLRTTARPYQTRHIAVTEASYT